MSYDKTKHYLEKELIVLDVVNQTGVVLINHSQLITATKQFENILTVQLQTK